MASGNIDKSFGGGYTFRLSWEETATSAADNTSTVKVTAKLISSGSYHINSSASKDISLTINGTKYTGTCTIGISGGQTKTLMTKTVTITHSSDGSKSISISGTLSVQVSLSSGYVSSVTASGTAKLTTLKRASTISASNGTLGTAQTITINKAVSSYTHTLTYTCGSVSGSIGTSKTSDTSISFTPPSSLASQNTTGKSVSITIKCQTYSGSTALGSSTKTITVSIPSSYKPSVSLSVSDAKGYADTYGGYIQGISAPTISLSETLSYDSPISTYKTVIGDTTYTKKSFTASVITGSSDIDISASVTDKRGRTSDTVRQTLTVLPYSRPSITGLAINRCTEDGTVDESNGKYIKVTFNCTGTSLNDVNTMSYILNYKVGSSTTWNTLKISGFENNFNVVNGSVVFGETFLNESYDVEIVAQDNFTSSVAQLQTGTAIRIINVNTSCMGIAFGRMSTKDALQCAFPAEFEKPVFVHQKIYGGGECAPVVIPAMTARSDSEQTMQASTITIAQMEHVRWATPGADSYLQMVDGGIQCLVDGYIEASGKLFYKSGFSSASYLRGALYQNTTCQYSVSIHTSSTKKFYTISIPSAVMRVRAGDMIYLEAIGDSNDTSYVIGYVDDSSGKGARHTNMLTVKYIG